MSQLEIDATEYVNVLFRGYDAEAPNYLTIFPQLINAVWLSFFCNSAKKTPWKSHFTPLR
jgi:hypothetical protein